MTTSYKIVIPMAGLGSRMRPHTWNRPKPLLYLAGMTVLDHSLDQFKTLPDVEHAEYVFIVSPNQGEQIQEHMQAVHPEKKVHFIVQEQMEGQSKALYLAKELLDGRLLVAFSDTLIETDLTFLSAETADGIAWVKPMEDPRRFGVVEVDQNRFAKKLTEKPSDISNNLVVVGFYYFREGRKLIEAIEEQVSRKDSLKGEYFLSNAINILLEHGAKIKAKQTEVWLDAGIPEALLETNRYLLDHGRCNCEPRELQGGVTIIPPVSIPANVKLKSAVIGPHVTLGEECDLENVVIRDSIIEAGTRILDMVIESSIIGRDVILEGRPERLNIGDNSWMTR
ncbi:MAG: nucleotidyltransferase [Chloroflexi bacterium HGW-Chloroflexi-4]|jgi:glucose-1-phosphate thymidylyltransferase|nr:MAG: nucleotidyltransferase [Chloroflexi bacterium HGW-Chloroflexi-4]